MVMNPMVESRDYVKQTNAEKDRKTKVSHEKNLRGIPEP